MAVKQKNTKKKMALLGLKKDKDGDYRYIDPDDTTSEFVPVRNKKESVKYVRNIPRPPQFVRPHRNPPTAAKKSVKSVKSVRNPKKNL